MDFNLLFIIAQILMLNVNWINKPFKLFSIINIIIMILFFIIINPTFINNNKFNLHLYQILITINQSLLINLLLFIIPEIILYNSQYILYYLNNIFNYMKISSIINI